MAISQTHFVDITSAVAGASATGAPSLQHRRFTTGKIKTRNGGDSLPGEITKITFDMLDALNDILTDNADRLFARQYFSVKTVAPVSKPKSIEFVNYELERDDVPLSELFGDAEVGLDSMQGAAGSLVVETTAGTTTITLGASGVHLTGKDSIAAVANAINEALEGEGANPAEIEFSTTEFAAEEGGETGTVLTVTYEETGPNSKAIFTVTGDAAEALGLTGTPSLGGFIPGGDDAFGALVKSRAVSKNFGSFSFAGMNKIDTETLTAIKNEHASYNVLHQLYIELDDKDNVEMELLYDMFKGVPMTGFVLSSTANEFKSAIPAGLIDATDYEGRNTVNQVMFRQIGGMTPDITSDLDKVYLDQALVNYYGETSVNATPLSFFMKGSLQGGVADPRDMMIAACEQWIKGKVASDLINTLVASRLPANLDGKARIRSMIIIGAVASSLRSGAIMPMKEFTPLQKEVIKDMTGDDEAWLDVMANGYWLDVEIRTVVINGIEEKHAYYTLIYSKADFIRKVVGSHNLI